MHARRWLMVAALVAAGLSTTPTSSAAVPPTWVSGTVKQGSNGDPNAVVLIEQRLPAGARGAVYDDADGFYYEALGTFPVVDGTGHYEASLLPGTYRLTAVDISVANAPKVFETVFPVGSSAVSLDAPLGSALDCTTVSNQTGVNLVGSVMTAVLPQFTAQPDQVTYQWYRHDPGDQNDASAYTRIDGARSSTYTLTPADFGRQVEVDVSGLSTHGNVTCDSTNSATVFLPPPTVRGANPAHFAPGQTRPVGTNRIGQRVHAPALLGLPATSAVTYQWFRKNPGAQPIHGAQGPTYRLHRNERGVRIYVVMSVSDPAYFLKSLRSDPVRVH